MQNDGKMTVVSGVSRERGILLMMILGMFIHLGWLEARSFHGFPS